ncbi:hypothetical protein C8R44DRAFT_853019 [Mycena epipterygia]|nr:hypothetical protein C8R44DRAFT_853019 [Mycena epipterygia]
MPGGAKHQKVWRAVSGGSTDTISGFKYRWEGTRVRADIPPVFGSVTAVQTVGEGGVKIPPERPVGANESDGALTPPPVLECTGAAKKAGGVWASKPAARDGSETEDGGHVNRQPVLGPRRGGNGRERQGTKNARVQWFDRGERSFYASRRRKDGTEHGRTPRRYWGQKKGKK